MPKQVTMLTKLYNIDWTKLRHAYGKATNVPEQIIALTSTNEKERAAAIWNLNSSIYHQGTLYSASPYAVPFLIELLEDYTLKRKEDILYLLHHLSVGDHMNFDMIKTGLTNEKLKTHFQPVNPYKKTHFAVQVGIPVYIQLLKDEDPKIRIAAAFILAWFNSTASEVIPQLAQSLNIEKEEKCIANMLLSLGMLSGYQSIHEYNSFIKTKLSGDSTLISVCAAIALVYSTNSITAEVISILKNAAIKENELIEDFPWYNGNLSSYATTMLEVGIKDNQQLSIVLIDILREQIKKLPLRNRYKSSEIKLVVNPFKTIDLLIKLFIKTSLNEITIETLNLQQKEFIRILFSLPDHKVSYYLGQAGLLDKKEALKTFFHIKSEDIRTLFDASLSLKTENGIKTASIKQWWELMNQSGFPAPQLLGTTLVNTLSIENQLFLFELAFHDTELYHDEKSVSLMFKMIDQWPVTARPFIENSVDRLLREGCLITEKQYITHLNNKVYTFFAALLTRFYTRMGYKTDSRVELLLQEGYSSYAKKLDNYELETLQALPDERREKFILNLDKGFPEILQGAWLYYDLYPSNAITAKMIEHISRWNKDHCISKTIIDLAAEKLADQGKQALPQIIEAANSKTAVFYKVFTKAIKNISSNK